ncbi:MAG TPA: hypothetical protein VK172_07505 [Lentimicrobium sp.]|jgi:hypothetical protein|nr:hypothetical protein [Lentimicrobium sp.]
MKRYFLILLVFIAFTAKSQIRPSDSLFLWVDFKQDKILISIPDQYINYRTQWPDLPKHVSVNQTLMLVPDLPAKDKLITILTKELNSFNLSADHEDQLKYLGNLVLLLFYSNNDLSYITQNYLQQLTFLTQKSSVKNEAVLVQKWIEMNNFK